MEKYAIQNDFNEKLRKWLLDARRVVIAGIGSSIRKDDFIGVGIVKKLRGKVSRSVHLIECEMSPENFLEPIIHFKPTHILLVNAAQLGLEPGSSRLIELNRISWPAVLTHALTHQIFREFLTEATGAKVALLAVQPKDTSFGEGFTKELEGTVERLSSFLSRVLP
ncbi:MAG: hypothetical protein AVW05_01040 [Hadesarchaea archaeon DG-33]|nr:MAG: hypothetical protein AVW05_01040 [Hadesarchaea archaeon DG-33]